MSSARSPQPRRGTASRRVQFRIRPAAVVMIIAVLGLFVAGAVIGGPVGGLIIGALAAIAGVLLVLRWRAIDPQIRVFRAVVVAVVLVVAIAVATRG